VEERSEEKCQDVEMVMPREVCTLAPRPMQKVHNAACTKLLAKQCIDESDELMASRTYAAVLLNSDTREY
jgi:hypothetical protein